jgi:hypothetical protein
MTTISDPLRRGLLLSEEPGWSVRELAKNKPALIIGGNERSKRSAISFQSSARQENTEDFAQLLTRISDARARISLFLQKAEG